MGHCPGDLTMPTGEREFKRQKRLAGKLKVGNPWSWQEEHSVIGGGAWEAPCLPGLGKSVMQSALCLQLGLGNISQGVDLFLSSDLNLLGVSRQGHNRNHGPYPSYPKLFAELYAITIIIILSILLVRLCYCTYYNNNKSGLTFIMPTGYLMP